MNEVTKLYENAGVKVPIVKLKIFKDDNGKIYTRPPFTAEKQLELIKWLIKYDELHADFNDNEYGFSSLNYSGNYKKDFAEALASVINFELWQTLTEEERKQIKEVLE